MYRTTPAILARFRSNTASADTLNTPRDGTPYDEHDDLYEQALKAGQTVLRVPANVVKAHVYVLTDYRCGSVCIGFVDELKRLPGVQQIGVDTFIDSRTGSPMLSDLPSGNGAIGVPTMTRDGRRRGDNVPQRPDIECMGNIADTDAVKAWIRADVVRHPVQD